MTNIGMEYARALFELALEKGNTDDCLEYLQTLKFLLKENPEYAEVLSSPVYSRREKYGLIDKAFAQAFPEEIVSFLKLFVARGHIGEYDAFLAAFESIYEDYNGIIKVYAYTAFPLNEEERTRLIAKLEEKYSRRVLLTEDVNSDLLGGIMLYANGTVTDATLRGQLHEIEEVMNG